MTSNDVRVLRTQKGQTIKNENFSKLDFLKLYFFSLKDVVKNMKVNYRIIRPIGKDIQNTSQVQYF